MGLDAAILGMLNDVLLKPTGGIDWSNLTPNYAHGTYTSHPTTETAVLTITGAGYLTSFLIKFSLLGAGITATANIYLDGTKVVSFSITGNSDSTLTTKSIEQSPLWHYASELKFTIQYSQSPNTGEVEYGFATSQE